jgi:long-chain fatty acid transport protein
VGFLTPFDVVVRGRILYPEKPQFLLADRVQSVAVQAGLGIDLGYGIRVGGGFAALAALTGSVIVATDDAGRLGTTVEDTLVASYMPIVGASWEFWDDKYRVGATFRGVLEGRFNVIIEAENLGQITIPPLNISGVAQYDPWQVALEVARIKGDWRLAVGATYKHWPAYGGPAEATVRCIDRLFQDVPCDPIVPPDPDYSPVVSPRIGVERVFGLAREAAILARGGFAFEPSPAPEQTGRTNYFDNHRSIYSLGFGLRLPDPIPVSFDGFAQVQWMHARSHEKNVADGALTGGAVNTSGVILAGGTSASVRF